MNNERLVQCFVDGLGVQAGQVTDDLAYQSVPAWDSTGHMALVAVIEQVFDVMLDTDDIIGMSSVSVAREILRKRGVVF